MTDPEGTKTFKAIFIKLEVFWLSNFGHLSLLQDLANSFLHWVGRFSQLKPGLPD